MTRPLVSGTSFFVVDTYRVPTNSTTGLASFSNDFHQSPVPAPAGTAPYYVFRGARADLPNVTHHRRGGGSSSSRAGGSSIWAGVPGR